MAVTLLHIRCPGRKSAPGRFRRQRVVGPLVGVDHIHIVNVAIQKDGLSRSAAPHPAQYAAIPVDEHLVETILFHLALHQLGHFRSCPEGLGIEQPVSKTQSTAGLCPCLCSFLNLCHTLYAICNISIFIMNCTLVEDKSPASPKDFYGTYQRPDTILWNSPRKHREDPDSLRVLSLALLPIFDFVRTSCPDSPADSMDHARNIPQAVFHGAEPVTPHQLLRAGAVPGLDGLRLPMLGNGNLSQPVTVEIMVFDPLDMEDHGGGENSSTYCVVCPHDNRVMEELSLRDRIGAVITAAGIHKGGGKSAPAAPVPGP